MAAMRSGPRLAVGSAAWIAEERTSSLQIARSEVEEFSFSARNEIEWLNEHMSEIFSENQMNVAELFKTPGKLRGKTPRTARKLNAGKERVPLSNLFSTTPKDAPNPFAIPGLHQAATPKIKIAEDPPEARPVAAPEGVTAPASPHAHASMPVSAVDSGYHGSQSQEIWESKQQDADVHHQPEASHDEPIDVVDFAHVAAPGTPRDQTSPTQASLEDTFESAKEEQTRFVTATTTVKTATQPVDATQPTAQTADAEPTPLAGASSPNKTPAAETSPVAVAPVRPSSPAAERQDAGMTDADDLREVDAKSEGKSDDTQSPSDASSPIRPLVRKSSLNFASLPAREPLTSTKSLGARVSRTSHLEQTRASYYQRHTGGKSLGGTHAPPDPPDNDDQDEMDVDNNATIPNEAIVKHNKSYTQRLQDQISMLGKSQGPSQTLPKSLGALLPTQQTQQPGTTLVPQQSKPPAQQPHIDSAQSPSPSPKRDQPVAAPGAFPDEDDDDWISPPSSISRSPPVSRPNLPKSYTADVMEGVHGKDTLGGSEFVLPRTRPTSPAKAAYHSPARTAGMFGHAKSASVPSLPNMKDAAYAGAEAAAASKGISVSNPALNAVSEEDVAQQTPSKSPSRTLRDSPLKQVKNKLSSILKSSKGLLASSAALSAEGKSSLLSPSTTRLGFHAGPSTDSLRTAEPLYPDLSQQPSAASRPESAAGTNGRKTRASAEREKREAKEREREVKEREREAREREKEFKEAKKLAEQMEKLERAREKEREKARVFSKEQEKLAAMERQVVDQKEHVQLPQSQPAETLAPVPPPKNTPRATRSSPRRAPMQTDTQAASTAKPKTPGPTADTDVDTVEAPAHVDPSQASRTAPSSTSTARSQQQGAGFRRPTKPTKEAPTKIKQAPTVIRVNTTSAQQSQFHPSNSALAATLHDTLGPQSQAPPRSLVSKASHASLQTKPSLQSLKSSVSSSGRPKALDLAAKKKEQEEREAQRRRDAKLEIERKRAAAQEEERRQEQLRRQEAERKKEEERRQQAAAAQAKKDSQRQAAIERAKQTRAPPPAVRQQQQQPNAPPSEHGFADKGPTRPPSRLGSMIPQEGGSRPVNAVLSSTAAKMASKRPLQQDAGDDGSRQPVQRAGGPLHQAKEVKRMRMSEEFDDDIDMADSQPNIIKGPPVRPSGGLKKELPSKGVFTNGYTPAGHHGVSRDLFKATVTGQHNTQAKAAHPLDMAQLSKGAIPFATNPSHGAGPSTHKTPARPPAGPTAAKSAAKSATRSSPRFQNGDAIELPEIQTDDEDDEDSSHIGVAAWADSPDLRRALMRQETIDPMQIFGAPAPLNMEEVFHKSKDRFHKFRARTSSANWSGSDRLTEEDIRKDLQARDRMRREGGWTYDLNRDGLV